MTHKIQMIGKIVTFECDTQEEAEALYFSLKKTQKLVKKLQESGILEDL